MNSRLVPWCLAATAFVVAISLFGWRGKLVDPAQRVQPPAASGYRFSTLATEQHAPRPADTPVAAEPPETAPTTMTLPLPPATQPEPDASVQATPDDAPTVEDLPAPRNSGESSNSQ